MDGEAHTGHAPRDAGGSGPRPFDPPEDLARTILESAQIVAGAQVRLGSNFTFLVHLDAGGDGRVMRAIYKPRDGERPLADYPGGTLYKRERAAYLAAEHLGWPPVPMTVIRDGPYGPGSMQRFVEFDPAVTYFNLREDRLGDLAPFAAFDLLVNNGDRKGGHFLADGDGRVWSVDHGLTFSEHFTLRTVMLEFWGEPIPAALVEDLAGLVPDLEPGGGLSAALDGLVSAAELTALRGRLSGILESPVHPVLDPYRNVPWPLV